MSVLYVDMYIMNKLKADGKIYPMTLPALNVDVAKMNTRHSK